MADIRQIVQQSALPVDDLDLPTLRTRAMKVKAADQRRQRRTFGGVAVVVILLGALTASPLMRGSAVPGEVAVGQGGSPLDDIRGQSILGEGELSLGDFAGQPLLVYLWASWCGPCPEALPDLAAVAAAHPDLAVVTIAVQDVPERTRSALEEAGVDLPTIGLDDPQALAPLLTTPTPLPVVTADGQPPVAVPSPLDADVHAVPTTIALDAQHEVVDTYLGPPSAAIIGALADAAETGTPQPVIVTSVPTETPGPGPAPSPEYPILSIPASPTPDMPNLVPSPLPDDGIRRYQVQPGDTLSTIAEAVYGDALAFAPIAEANDLSGDNPLQVGQVLVIPEVAAAAGAPE